jgi:hypothetical protein
MKTSKQQTPTKTYRPSGFGVMTRIEAVVTDVTFVDGMVEAMVHMGVSEPMKVRFTIEQAREHDIIEEVE